MIISFIKEVKTMGIQPTTSLSYIMVKWGWFLMSSFLKRTLSYYLFPQSVLLLPLNRQFLDAIYLLYYSTPRSKETSYSVRMSSRDGIRYSCVLRKCRAG